MRPHVDAARDARFESHRTEMIEEDERPDHPLLAERQHAPHLESTEIAAARFYDEFDHDALRSKIMNHAPASRAPR